MFQMQGLTWSRHKCLRAITQWYYSNRAIYSVTGKWVSIDGILGY